MNRLLPVIAALLIAMLSIAAIAPSSTPPPRRSRPPAPPPAQPPPSDISNVAVDYWKASGRKFHAGDPNKPAILLFHGLHRDIRCWTNPGDDEGVLCYTFREPMNNRSLGTKDYPGV